MSNVHFSSVELLTLKRKEETGLPVNIWVDDSGDYMRNHHSKGIKFQLNKSYKAGGQPFAFMNLKDTIYRGYNFRQNNELTEDEIQQIREFVLNNSDILSKIADEDVSIDLL